MEKKEKKIIFEKLTPYLVRNKLLDDHLEDILKVEKINKEDFYSLFPYQTKSLCTFFFNQKHIFIKNINKKKIINEKSISKKVALYLEASIVFLEKNKDISIFFLNFLILHPILFTKISISFAILVWNEISDPSLDFNYYSKRYILSKIYESSLFYWRGSLNFNKTVIFIKKQINSLGLIGKVKANTKKMLSKLPIKSFLSKLDFMH